MEPARLFLGLFVAVPVIALSALTTLWLRAAWSERRPHQLPEELDEAYNEDDFEPLPRDRRAFSVWAMTILLSFLFFLTGLPKLGLEQEVLMRFGAFDLPEWARYAVGGVELLGAILLLFPRAAFYAASGLMFVALGAIYSHTVGFDLTGALLPVMAFFGLSYVAWCRRPGAEAAPMVERLA